MDGMRRAGMAVMLGMIRQRLLHVAFVLPPWLCLLGAGERS